MELLLFWGLVAVLTVFLILREIFSARRKVREFEQTLRLSYGNPRKREYKAERFERMDRYFRKHPEEDQIDDITWNDLGMDDIFKGLNDTYSAIGEEYLYYMLRSAGRGEEDLRDLEKRIAFWDRQEDARVFLQLRMAKLGYLGKYSMYDYLDNLDYLGQRSSRKSLLLDGIIVAGCVAMPFFFMPGLIVASAGIIYNVLDYFRQKSEIEPYIISFSYVLKLLTAAEEISRMKPGEQIIEEDLEKIRRCCGELSGLKRASGAVISGGGVIGGNPLEIVLDYIKMAFHIDLICFNRMLVILRQKTDTVDELVTLLGRLECAVAIGSFRKSCENGFCIPEFAKTATVAEGPGEGVSQETELCMTEMYHPLLSKPVKNSICTNRGVLITGSNASGKSTFLKTAAINALMAQTIHTCTAKAYSAPLFRIFSSMALRDDLMGGDSYYIVEIKALNRILRASQREGRPILCFVDEVLRGTNTVERIAASTQILKSLGKTGVICFAATHDMELCDLLADEYSNYHFEEEVRDGDIFFAYRLCEGKAMTRNAIRLLEIIGYDAEIIEAAEHMAADFLKKGAWSGG